MTPIHVAVAVIQDESGRVLLSRRAAQSHQGGLWEFPGGKLDPGESFEQALVREVWEELGLRVKSHRPLIRITHHYPDRSVLLEVHKVTRVEGQPEGREGQPLVWCALEALGEYSMPIADRPIVTALRLPDSYLITDAGSDSEEAFLARTARSIRCGQRLIQLRAPEMDRCSYLKLAGKLSRLCHRFGADLLLNVPLDCFSQCDADGIHLTSRRLMALESRPLTGEKWVAASCHSEQELIHAERIGVDFAVVSPVLATASHPDARPLGWEGFSLLAEQAALPVYALGGMSLDLIEQAQKCGGQGIAAIRGLSGWRPGCRSTETAASDRN